MFTIRPVTTREELEAVFRLRYGVIVKELGDPAPADTDLREMIEDPADATGHNLAAFAPDGSVLATVRFNIVSEGLYRPSSDVLERAGVTINEPTTTALTSRFVADWAVRAGPLPIRLVRDRHSVFLNRDIRRNLIYVRRVHKEFYHRLGYVTVSDAHYP